MYNIISKLAANLLLSGFSCKFTDAISTLHIPNLLTYSLFSIKI